MWCYTHTYTYTHIYTMEYYSVIKKSEIMPFPATWMNLGIIILSGVIRKIMTNTVWYHLYVESKIWCKLTYLWNRNRLWDIENRLMVAKGEGCGGEMDWEFGISRSKLLYIGWVNKVPCIAQETIMTKNMK